MDGARNEPPTSGPRQVRRIGCGQAIVVLGMLLWLGAVPVGLRLAAALTPGTVAPLGGVSTTTLVVAAVALSVPFLGTCAAARRQAAWQSVAGVAAACAATGGFIVLDAALHVASPTSATTLLLGESVWVITRQLILLLLYALLVAWVVPKLARSPRRPLAERLGLGRPGLQAVSLALGAAALVTVPWPVTGALGDSQTSLNLLLQTAAAVVPEVLVFWGALFSVLLAVLKRPRMAALITVLLHGLSALGTDLATAGWGGLGQVLPRVVLGLLLSEFRAGGSSIFAPLVVAYGSRVVPHLFVDPRDAILSGIPEPQHIAAQTVSLATMVVLSLLPRIGRLALRRLGGALRLPGRVLHTGALCVALVTWGLWGGVYAVAGTPGFSDHGFIIVLDEQADLEAARALADRDSRLATVYQVLVETAERTQAPLRAELESLGLSYRPFYLINMIRVDGHRGMMRHFEGRTEVAQVILNPNVRTYPRRAELPYGGDFEPVDDVQSNLAAIRADSAWSLGIKGEGIVVAGQDTGYDWRHPALKTQYRGWVAGRADHDYNWHDAWDATPVPFDDGTHGTHTMGIVLGDDGAGNRTGVAPDAQWMGCRNMRRGLGNPGSYVECMEFFLAPYPLGGDPLRDGDVSLAPHVVNNSWACPDLEGCLPGTLRRAVEALRAAGIMMVTSAGNEGPACGTLTTPPANYDAAFSVGATNDDQIVESFSSRGPASGLVKPDVAAPGSYVRSCVAGGGYGYAGGTSMAGPHVAGLVALLWSADPDLVGDVDGTESLICQTAVPRPVDNACSSTEDVPRGLLAGLLEGPVCACGDVDGVPNNVYGCGFIDVEAAVRAAIGG